MTYLFKNLRCSSCLCIDVFIMIIWNTFLSMVHTSALVAAEGKKEQTVSSWMSYACLKQGIYTTCKINFWTILIMMWCNFPFTPNTDRRLKGRCGGKQTTKNNNNNNNNNKTNISQRRKGGSHNQSCLQSHSFKTLPVPIKILNFFFFSKY